MEDFLKGTSVLASLPTLAYIGFYQRRNRLNLLNNLSESSEKALQNFLSIPYESIVVGVSIAYGLMYTILKKGDTSDADVVTEQTFHTQRVIVLGSMLGLILSLIGRFQFDLPSKLFGIVDKQYSVHIVAPILYIFIFLYVDQLLKL